MITFPRTRARPAGRAADRGSLSLMIVVLFVALAALAGIIVDGGGKLTGDEDAAAAAQEAARAGAASVNTGGAYGSGTFAVNQAQAASAAQAYLAAAGYADYTVRPHGADAIWVHVTITRNTTFLSIIGIDTFTCSGTAVASLVTGPGGAS